MEYSDLSFGDMVLPHESTSDPTIFRKVLKRGDCLVYSLTSQDHRERVWKTETERPSDGVKRLLCKDLYFSASQLQNGHAVLQSRMSKE